MASQESNGLQKPAVMKTHSAPKPEHIYDRPEGRDEVGSNGNPALSYAISGPLDDKALPSPRQSNTVQAQRRSAGDIQISDLDDILESIESTRRDLGKLEEQNADSTVTDTTTSSGEKPHFYDRPEHTEKSKSRERSLSLNQRPRNTDHEVCEFVSGIC